MLNLYSHPYELDKSTTFWGLWVIFLIYDLNFKRNLCLQTAANLIRRRVLRHLNWFCTNCHCPTKEDARLIWLNPFLEKLHLEFTSVEVSAAYIC